MLRRVDIVGNPNIGVLEVEVVKSSIAGSNLIGSLAVANSDGIIVSPHVLDREVKQFEELGLNVASLPSQYTAVGNIVACNDTGAIVSPFLSEDAINVIENALNVDVEAQAISGSDIVGSLIKVTNKGFLISKDATSSEINLARKVFGVEGDIGTVGKGIPLVGACSIANSNGAIVAKGSTGPEMARVEEALGFLDDNF